jgi:hypothetical protein
LDKASRRIVISFAVLFLACVALQINGSSVGQWKAVLRDRDSPEGVLYSSPKNVRSDEWLAWTPSLISQALHLPAFPVENPSVGAAKAPLIASLPVRHFIMLFRPQLYGFFLFKLEPAYAFYWGVKVFGLLTAFFFLFRILTGGKFWISLFGTLWIFFSAYIQWWFSCPPMLPEMLASWALAIICVICLFQKQTLPRRIAAGIGLIVGSINFVLCFYPPFQIPLIYIGIAALTGWFWQRRDTPLDLRCGIISCAVALALLLTMLLPYFHECLPTLKIIAGTSYPGARQSYGGELKIREAFNGVLGFFNSSETTFLESRGNSCEASNFWPLWLLVLATGGFELVRDRKNRRVEIALLCCLAGFTLYAFCPCPQWLCRLTLMSYVPGIRDLLACGLAGIMFATLSLARRPPPLKVTGRILLALAALLGVLCLIIASRTENPYFLNTQRIAALIGINAVLISLYFFAPLRFFCPILIGCLVLNNGPINPIATGLGPLIEATPSDAIRKIVRSDPGGKWVGYSSAWLPQFLKAQGADVISGLAIVPDLPFCHALDPSRKFEPIYNRYALAIFLLPDHAAPPEFALGSSAGYSVLVSMLHPVLQQRDVRYAVFPDKLIVAPEAGIQLLASFPENQVWVYKLPSARNAHEPNSPAP